jgi:hypothetical protein
VGLSEISEILWRERNLLELLAYKLEAERMVLESGRVRWLPHAAREVETVASLVREAELDRAMTVDAAAPSLGLRPGATLRELAEAAPGPWSAMFADHRLAFIALTDEIAGMAAVNEALLNQGARAVQVALDELLARSAAAEGHGHGRRAGHCSARSSGGPRSQPSPARPEVTDVR